MRLFCSSITNKIFAINGSYSIKTKQYVIKYEIRVNKMINKLKLFFAVVVVVNLQWVVNAGELNLH